MRVLLAAFQAAKGEVDDNLRGHVALLERARSAGCDLAVFPEFSLTGSVDPTRHPEHTLALDAEPVQALVAAAHRIGVGAVFGIAERAADGFYISQLYTYGGRLLGAYRKRHLGEDELGYRTGTEDGVFSLEVVFFCSAPGLYGRRTDEQSWRAGHAWWESSGLGDARRYAREHGLWVAMATQAGSAHDEDFPGLAALVTPEGEVTRRLPDWRPGVLVVDLPVEATVHPVRRAARALVVDEAGRTLLMRFRNERTGAVWWSPPGGGLEPGEDYRDAVRRELREELGRDGLALGPWIGERTRTFEFGEGWLTQRERWALCRTASFEPDAGRLPALRAENVHEVRWWTAGEIRAAGILTTPRDLPDLLERVNAGRLPEAATDLGGRGIHRVYTHGVCS